MCPSGQHGDGAADGWIGTLAQSVGGGSSQTGHANQRSDDQWIEVLDQQWLVLATALDQAGSVGIGCTT